MNVVVLMLYSIILIFLVILYYKALLLFNPLNEKYTEEPANNNSTFMTNGRCNCCSCGWQDCSYCTENVKKCCKNPNDFTRYTFYA